MSHAGSKLGGYELVCGEGDGAEDFEGRALGYGLIGSRTGLG